MTKAVFTFAKVIMFAAPTHVVIDVDWFVAATFAMVDVFYLDMSVSFVMSKSVASITQSVG